MGNFRWFKEYEMFKLCDAEYKVCRQHYIIRFSRDGGITVHAYEQMLFVKELFKKFIGISFPQMSEEDNFEKGEKLNLISPNDMSKYCEEILRRPETNAAGMSKTFETFKELSDKGYYIAYEPYNWEWNYK